MFHCSPWYSSTLLNSMEWIQAFIVRSITFRTVHFPKCSKNIYLNTRNNFLPKSFQIKIFSRENKSSAVWCDVSEISDCLTPDPSYPTIPFPNLHNGSIFPLSKIYNIGNTFLTKRFLQLDQELAWEWWKMVPVILWGLHWFWPNQPVINPVCQ